MLFGVDVDVRDHPMEAVLNVDNQYRMNMSWADDKERLVLYLDIMGFKEHVSRTNITSLKNDLLTFKTKNVKLKPLLVTESERDKKDMMKMAQFSDSIVVVSNGNEKNDLNRITKAASILMQTALETGFALRGAIAAGNMVFDEANQLFFGKALVDAYLLEEDLAYYGVVFHESVEKLVSDSLANAGRTYFPIKDERVPFKNGKSSHYHVTWYDIKKNLSRGNIRDEAKDWLRFLRRSVSGKYRIYLDNTLMLIDGENN